jgi:hypothetical protein
MIGKKEVLNVTNVWYGMEWYGMVWYGIVGYVCDGTAAAFRFIRSFAQDF